MNLMIGIVGAEGLVVSAAPISPWKVVLAGVIWFAVGVVLFALMVREDFRDPQVAAAWDVAEKVGDDLEG